MYTKPVSFALVTSCCLLTSVATAQQQQGPIRPPIVRYWMTASVDSGFGGGMGSGQAPSIAQMMQGAMSGGGAPSATKHLLLELGSDRSAPSPSGNHGFPAATGLGNEPLLLNPPAPGRGSEPTEKSDGRARIRAYWGCGESVGPGQPVVLDTADFARGRFFDVGSVRINAGPQRPGAAERGYIYAPHPNEPKPRTLPPTASLVGEHAVDHNLGPMPKFAVGADHDFLEPVALRNEAAANGSVKLSWNNVARSLGYAAGAFGGKDEGGVTTLIVWSSSAQKFIGMGGLASHLPPAEVQRLVRERVLLAPSQTECVMPREVVKELGQGGMLQLTAFGPELNLVHPPRPSDIRAPWNQEWSVKVRQVSRGSGMLGLDMASAAAGSGNRQEPGRPTPTAAGQEEKSDTAVVNPVDAVKGLFRGILGR